MCPDCVYLYTSPWVAQKRRQSSAHANMDPSPTSLAKKFGLGGNRNRGFVRRRWCGAVDVVDAVASAPLLTPGGPHRGLLRLVNCPRFKFRPSDMRALTAKRSTQASVVACKRLLGVTACLGFRQPHCSLIRGLLFLSVKC